MPITTRAAALRSQANGDLNHSQDQATSTPTSTVKTTRKCSSRQKHKTAHVQPMISCAKSGIYSPSQQKATTFDVASAPEVIHQSDHEDVVIAQLAVENNYNFIFTI
ncbi:unnamed protein product [Rotaria sordida]|uniref:Uncharacterized protein n=2 Tax=Rotaria sordida TaxID=392033 RepID=A0A814I2W8_9BILA|nr:unnamed protein product [Rotaria sordida]